MKKRLLTIVLVLALVSGLALTTAACSKGELTVTFDANKPAAATAAVSDLPELITGVKKNATIAEPVVKPTLTGYDFGGWYKETGCATAWTFATDKVTKSMTLYAKWTAKPPALAAPTELAIASADIEGDNVYTLSWKGVSNASGYTVSVGTQTHQTTGVSLDLTALNLDAGVYDIKVLAKGDGTNYSNSGYSAVVRHYQGTEGLAFFHNQFYPDTWIVNRGSADLDGNTVVVASQYKGEAVAVSGNGLGGQYQTLAATTVAGAILPEGMTMIGMVSFAQCTSLTEIVVPSTVTEIGMGAFNGCTALAKVYYGGANSTAWGQITIGTSNAPLSAGTVTLYYYSETAPAGAGNFWHWVNGVPTAWA